MNTLLSKRLRIVTPPYYSLLTNCNEGSKLKQAKVQFVNESLEIFQASEFTTSSIIFAVNMRTFRLTLPKNMPGKSFKIISFHEGLHSHITGDR